MNSHDLIVIEAPGKLRSLRAVLSALGVNADICATMGHFLENPSDLRDVGIVYRDARFAETSRMPHRQMVYSHLRAALARCEGRIIVATDNDPEGHVIARDVAELARAVRPGAQILRALFNALDPQSVGPALSTAAPFDLSDALLGDVRRITDRLIAVHCSDIERGMPVGRVQTAILALCSKGIAHGVVRHSLPASSGSPSFHGAIPIVGETTPAALLAALGDFKLVRPDTASSTPAPLGDLPTYDQVLLDVHGKLDIGIKEASDLLQKMYEDGEISYPRSTSRSFSAAAADRIARLASLRGIQAFRRSNLPIASSEGRMQGHEPVHIVSEQLLRRLDLGKPLALHEDLQSAAASLIARRCIEAGVQVMEEHPSLEGLPAWARRVDWYRVKSKPPLPWASAAAPIEVWSPQGALVRAMVGIGIGRPGTWAAHAERAVARRLVDQSTKLTPRGEALLAQAPPELRDVAEAAQLEAALNGRSAGAADRDALISECLRRALGEGGRAAVECALAAASDPQDATLDAEDVPAPTFQP